MRKILVILTALLLTGCGTTNPHKPQTPKETLLVENQSTQDVLVYVNNGLLGKVPMLSKKVFAFPIGGKGASYTVCRSHRRYCERAVGTVWDDSRADHYLVVINTGSAAVMWEDL